ncbi:IRK-interacting protein [Vigna unguiculata]|uniref:IRK-interacting protein n=1 Tax=Vigna unguiculata TaxID=3917 RepID=UPI00101625CF|nr:IRK-interacting protein [Vigna unguiculata]
MASSSKSPHFTPIQEEREEDTPIRHTRSTPSHHHHHHPPTPILNTKSNTHKKKRSESEEDSSVSCNKCRPHSRDKIFILPFDHAANHNASNTKQSSSSLLASPNGIFRSLVSKLTRKSPMSSSHHNALPLSREEQWKMAVAELSHKLLHATRKRDEALLEASRLMHSMGELEKKLNKLELYCHTLKSGLEECTNANSNAVSSPTPFKQSQTLHQDAVIQHFLVSVSEARSSVKLLSRSLTMQLRHMGSKVYEKVSFLLQPYDVKISFSKNPRSLLFYLEALLNRTFFEDFETIGFQKNACNAVLNPVERCEGSFRCFNMLQGLTWEEVLSKGTRHFSEEFSRFCDRKMSEIVAMLGWNRAWPEPLLQAFFGASKSVWMVHLLANSVHPSLPIFRVDKGVNFDSVYMEDMGGDKASKLVPSVVRIMVTPGFYVYGSAVKCKVLCRYLSSNNTNNDTNTNHNHSNNSSNKEEDKDKGLSLNPTS